MQGVHGRSTGFKKIETTTLTLRCFRWFELLDFLLSQYKLDFFSWFFSQSCAFKQVESTHCVRPKLSHPLAVLGSTLPPSAKTRSLMKPGKANSLCHGVFVLVLVWGGGCVWVCSWKHRPRAGQELAGSCGCSTVPWHVFQSSFNWLQPEFASCLFLTFIMWVIDAHTQRLVLAQQRRDGANLKALVKIPASEGLLKQKTPKCWVCSSAVNLVVAEIHPPPYHKLVFAFLLLNTYVCRGNAAIALHKHFPNAVFTQK